MTLLLNRRPGWKWPWVTLTIVGGIEYKGMSVKRYRILNVDFDTRATILSQEIKDDCEEHIKEIHRGNKASVSAGLRAEFGERFFDAKIQNFIDVGTKPLSIVAYHNKFFEQARSSFVVGSYYPALTAVCALGERILNHLMLLLRDVFKGTPEYKKVYRKDSFDHWDLPIETLETWKVLLPATSDHFRKLSIIRNRHAIHFNPDTDSNDRPLALEAIKLMNEIIACQFSGFAGLPWGLGIPGEIYIKKASENEPFVAKVYLPNCLLLGPHHTIDDIRPDGTMVVRDAEEYEDREISDEEFCTMRNERQKSRRNPHLESILN